MRRRRIGAAARWALLALTVALVVAWVGSVWYDVSIEYPMEPYVSAMRGALILEAPKPPMPAEEAPPAAQLRVHRSFAHEVWWRYRRLHLRHEEVTVVPLWWPVAVVGALTMVAWRKRLPLLTQVGRENARRRRGVCASCGYDRRGLTATAACPECGAAPAG